MNKIEQYDAICKKLLSEKMVLAWILKESVDDFKEYDISYIAENCLEEGEGSRIIGINTESVDESDGDIRYDLCFKAKGKNGDVIIDVEAQNYTSSVTYPLIKRAGYYCARLISSQKNTEFSGMDYGKIKKVYSIWINFGVKKDYENIISRFFIAQMHSNGKKMYEEKDYRIFEIQFISLKKEGYYTDNKLLRMLNVIFSNDLKFEEKNTILRAEYGYELTSRKEYASMCNFGEAIFEDGLEQGVKQGFKKGEKQGFQKGINQTQSNNIRNLMTKMNFTFDQAADFFEIFDDRKREELKKLIMEQ